MTVFEFSAIHGLEHRGIDISINNLEEIIEIFIHQTSPWHERKNFSRGLIHEYDSQSLVPMIYLCAKTQEGITVILVPKPTDLVPEAVLKIVAQASQFSRHRIRP